MQCEFPLLREREMEMESEKVSSRELSDALGSAGRRALGRLGEPR